MWGDVMSHITWSPNNSQQQEAGTYITCSVEPLFFGCWGTFEFSLCTLLICSYSEALDSLAEFLLAART